MEQENKGRIKQSVCKWCYPKQTVDELCQKAKEMGIASVELLGENEWDIPKKYGLTCAMPSGLTGISDGWNNPERHEHFIALAQRLIPKVKASGLPNLIVFSGNRGSLSDQEGLENCARGLKQIMPIAEKEGVTIVMELLNSKVDHKDYQCDHTAWGAKLCDKVGSERFKLLYDIYHMQIMEGDVIRTIRNFKQYIAHYHTGGVPGRREIDEGQELNYTTICRAIADTGFTGYLAQEFIPARDPMTSLAQAVKICTV
jgi:hydroxypyruvate isomerase